MVSFCNAGVNYVRDQTENTFHIMGVQGFIIKQLAWLYVSLPKNGQLCFGFLQNNSGMNLKIHKHEPIQWVNTRIKQ